MKERIDKQNFIKIKIIMLSKGTVRRINKKATDSKKIFAK